MAVSFTSLTKTHYFTSELETVTITTDSPIVEFHIYHQGTPHGDDDGRTLLFQSEYAVRNSRMTIYDIAEILETHLEQNLVTVQEYVFVAIANGETAEQSLTCCFCKQRFEDAEDFIVNHFLTTHISRLIPANGELTLTYYVEPGTSSVTVTFKVTYRTADGSIHTGKTTQYRMPAFGNNYLYISAKNIKQWMSYYFGNGEELLSVKITIGKRQAHIYFTPSRETRVFSFRNAFNCLDTVFLSTKRITKTETKSTIATLCNQKLQYDIEHTRSYRETTSQLTKDEALLITEMLTSKYVAIQEDGIKEPILITDYKSEITDEQGEGNTLEFEWEYASVRYKIDKDLFTRIFTTEYEKPFA